MIYSKIYSSLALFWRSLLLALKDYWSFWPTRLYLSLSFIIQIFLWWRSYAIYQALADDLLIFHYTVDFGIDSAGPAKRLFLPLLAFIFLFLNFILSLISANSKQSRRLWHLFGLTSVALQIFITLALLAIYFINFLA